ncbi:hypothetical protein U9M48_025897 [Paspalum notatum var. saurae]|uniref:Uncharacterized protein n=1 Tax=Paspalum notatum var. saurae TaxID=547442 RepID=A0AAQ3TRD3_PASNO
MPAMKRAQVNLCRRLGFPTEEEGHNSVEQALKDYVAMFDTALPDFAIAALSNLLGVDDEYIEQLDEALIGMVGQGIDGLIAGEGIPAAGVAAAVLNNFVFKPANGTKGGILLLWNDTFVDVTDISIKLFSVMATLTVKSSNTSFLITVVYGPMRGNRKPTFLRELRRLKPSTDQKWLVLRDFNLIYRARDKNNRNLNLRTARNSTIK